MGNKTLAAQVSMVIVTLMWAAGYITAKMALDGGMTPNVYTSFRFCGAALVMALIFHKNLLRADKKTIKAGIYIGLAAGIAYVIQNIGLNMTTASKAGFLTGLYIVLVPIFDCTLKHILPKKNEVIGISVATIGLAVLSLNANFSIGLGDILVFISSVFFAISIVMIGHFAGDQDPIALSVIQTIVIGLMGLLLAVATEPAPKAEIFNGTMIFLVLYAIFFNCALNTIVQNVAQSLISPTAAALILVLEPVFSGIFAFFLLHEPLGIKELTGSGMIITGMLVTLLYKPQKKRSALKKHHSLAATE